MFSWFDVLVLFGMLQGAAFAALLLARKRAPAHGRLLAAILVVFSLLSFKILLHTLDLWTVPGFRYFPLGIDLFIQPLLFLYVRALTGRKPLQLRRAGIHLMPGAIFLLHAAVVYLAVLPVSNIPGKDYRAELFAYSDVKTAEDLLSAISGVLYWWCSLVRIKAYRRRLEDNISASNSETFNWLKNLLVITGLLVAVLAINIGLDQVLSLGSAKFFHWQLFYVYLSAVIFYMGLRGYLRINSSPAVIPVLGTESKNRYEKEELERAETAVMEYLVDRQAYKDSELTLQKMSAAIGINPSLVSAAVNSRSGKTFRTLVNDLRVNEVKRCLQDPAYAHLSILGIALECGFNSEASFYRIFKLATGTTPKEFAVGASTEGRALSR
jgi:AraC-like DNA-binding protein